jgi:2'-5' RNA ligase
VARSKRLFVGLAIPGSCKAVVRELDPHINGLRWVPLEQIHLTLSFLGDVGSDGEQRLRKALGDVRVPPFLLPLRCVGTFNSGERVSVVWVGVGKGHPDLFALHQRIQDAVLRAGLEADLRPFHPHVTVGRAKGVSREMLQTFLRKYADADFGMFEVSGFGLYSSLLGTEGALHRLEMQQEF